MENELDVEKNFLKSSRVVTLNSGIEMKWREMKSEAMSWKALKGTCISYFLLFDETPWPKAV